MVKKDYEKDYETWVVTCTVCHSKVDILHEPEVKMGFVECPTCKSKGLSVLIGQDGKCFISKILVDNAYTDRIQDGFDEARDIEKEYEYD